MSEKEFIEHWNTSQALIKTVCNNYCYAFSRKDLIQDIALELWKSRNNFKNNCTFSSWAYKIARNVCINTLRNKSKQLKLETIDCYIEDFVEYDNSHELIKQLNNANRYTSIINTIEEPYRTIFNNYVNGASFKDLERQSGINENALRVRVHRIKKQLRSHYNNARLN